MRITRTGCLAVHLMPRYHGRSLAIAVVRIVANGPRDEQDREAVRLANADDCGSDPLIKED
jgi:hypothetical protein